MPGQRLYIVNNQETIQAIQKQPKALSFLPISTSFVSKICGLIPAAKEITRRNPKDPLIAFAAALAPGPGLDGMNRVMIQNIAGSLDDLLAGGEQERCIRLGE